MEKILFCPDCGRFVGTQGKCHHCGWIRAVETGQIGMACWTAPVGDSGALIRKSPYPARFTQWEDLLVVPTDEGEVIAVSAGTGEVRWRRPVSVDGKLRTLELPEWRGLLLAGGEHLADLPTYDRRLLAWDAKTGEEDWSWPTRGDNLSVPLVEEDTAYFTSSEPQLYALDLTNRSPRWSALAQTWSPEQAAISNGIIVVPSRGPAASAHDAKDGRRLWTFHAQDAERESLHQRPVTAGGIAYLAGWGRWLYAVDLLSGALRWQLDAERGVTCPPALCGSLLLAGIKCNRPPNAASGAGYALVALDAATGQEAWRFPLAKHIYTCLVQADQFVVFGADDGRLYTLDLETGQEVWQFTAADRLRSGPFVLGNRVVVGGVDHTLYAVQWREESLPRGDPAELLAEGKTAEAAEQMALDGQYEAAARLYAGCGLLENAAALFLEANLPGDAADIYVEMEALDQALDLRRMAGDRPGEARVLSMLGKHNEAAQIFEEVDCIDAAVEEYRLVGRTGYAANLLLNVGRRKEAAELFNSINEFDRAAEALAEDGRLVEAAEIYQSMGKLEAAAEMLARGGLLAEAAALNEVLGKRSIAARQYAESGQVERALLLYESLEDWNSSYDLAGSSGDLPRLANAMVHLGKIEQAAETFERAGMLDEALGRYEGLGRLEKAAQLAGALERWERQAALLEQLGMAIQAGEAYLRGAEQLRQKGMEAAHATGGQAAPEKLSALEKPKSPDKPAEEETTGEMARLYESAAKCFLDGADAQRYEECWDKVCQYRQWPNIQGEFAVIPQFYQGEYRLVKLAVRNTGYSAAQNVYVLRASSKFQLDEMESRIHIRWLVPHQEREMVVSIKPRGDVVGQVVLRVTVGFADRAGQEREATFERSVRVLSQEEKRQGLESTPFPEEIVINLPGDVDLSRLRRGLAEYFNDDELQDLCLDLEIDYEVLAGETKTSKARELILFMVRHGRLNELLEICHQRRPKGSW